MTLTREERIAKLTRFAAMVEDARMGYTAPKAEETPNASIVTPVALGTEKTVHGAKAPRKDPKAPTAKDAPKTDTVETVNPYPIGSLDAIGFIQAIKLAGWRPRMKDDGKPLTRADGSPILGPTTEINKRADEHIAIQRFIGWDKKELHGTQLSNAQRKARLALDPSLGGNGVPKRHDPTIAGYVAGSCDAVAKRVAHLEAEERKIVGEIAYLQTPGCMIPVFDAEGKARVDAAGFQIRMPMDEDDRLLMLELQNESLVAVQRDLNGVKP